MTEPLRALLAISDPAVQTLWEEVLAEHGHTSVAAPTDAKGWSQRQQLQVEVAVIELVGDGRRALELCRRLHRLGDRRPNVLMLVHADQPDAAVAALQAGADDVLIGTSDRRTAVGHLAEMERRHAANRVPAPAPAAHELAATDSRTPYPPAATPDIAK